MPEEIDRSEVYGYNEVPFFRELRVQIDALAKQLTQEIRAVDRQYAQEIQSVREALAAEVELRRARREDDMRAVDKAEESMTKRLDAMNEIRQQLNDQARTFVTHAEFDGGIDKVTALADRNRTDLGTALPRETFEAALREWTNWRTGIDKFTFRLIGAFGLAMIVMPLLIGVAVYLLTRNAIPVTPAAPVTTP